MYGVGDSSQTPLNNPDYYPDSLASNLADNASEVVHGAISSAARALPYVAQEAGNITGANAVIDVARGSDTVNHLYHALSMKAEQYNDRIIQNNDQDIAGAKYDARYQGALSSFIGHFLPYAAFSAAGVGAGFAARGLGLASAAEESAASDVSPAINNIAKSNKLSRVAEWATGQVPEFASFNGSMIPQYYADGIQIDHQGKVTYSIPNSLQSAALSQIPYVGLKAAGWVIGRTAAKEGSSLNQHIDDVLSGDETDDELMRNDSSSDINDQVKQSIINKATDAKQGTIESSEGLSEEQKQQIDDQVNQGFEVYSKPGHSLAIPDENLQEYGHATMDDFEDATLSTEARRSIVSQGLIIDGMRADIRTAKGRSAALKIIRGYNNWYSQRGLRQVYLTEKTQEALAKIKDKRRLQTLNEIDKNLFDLKPFMSKNAKKAEPDIETNLGYSQDAGTGFRALPDGRPFYRFRKPKETPEFNRSLLKLQELARDGDTVAKYLWSLYNENVASFEARSRIAFHNAVKDAVINPMTDAEIRAFEESRGQGFADRADARLDQLKEESRQEFEQADFSDYLDPHSHKYIKLLQKIDSIDPKKMEAYYTCMLRT